jgi:hypothetical protein
VADRDQPARGGVGPQRGRLRRGFLILIDYGYEAGDSIPPRTPAAHSRRSRATR